MPESARNLVLSEALTDFYDDELRKCCDPDDDHHKFRWVRQKDIRKMNMQSKEDLMNVRLTMLFTREALNVTKTDGRPAFADDCSEGRHDERSNEVPVAIMVCSSLKGKEMATHGKEMWIPAALTGTRRGD